MKTEKLPIVRFAPRGTDSFYEAVNERASAYFEEKEISPYANSAMWVKTGIMLLLYVVPYVLMVTGLASGNYWLYFALWFMMGWGMAGIGTSVMHDTDHGTYSPNKKVNSLIGHALEIVGGYSVAWKIQHNVLHHTYTNIAGLDDDIDSIKLLHELGNTTNFAPRNRILTWFIGGLNFQIEHHFFTGICHVHYPKIAPIVKSRAIEFGLPYHEQATFMKALLLHAKMLKLLVKEHPHNN